MSRQIVQILLDHIVALANKDMKEMELIALVIIKALNFPALLSEFKISYILKG